MSQQLDNSQAQDNPPTKNERLLKQVYPPTRSVDDLASSQDTDPANPPAAEHPIQLLKQEQDYWEGLYRLAQGKTLRFQAHRAGQQVHIWIGGELYHFALPVSSSRGRTTQRISTDEILCSVPGVVLTVDVADGDSVVEGQTLLVIESMKTEQVVKSPRDGTVQRVAVQPGDRVDRGIRLVALAPLEKT